jgi:hypothetical protein
MQEKISADVELEGSAGRGALLEQLSLAMRSVYRFEARDRFGRLKWVEEVTNLVTTQGLNNLLTNQFKGSAYTAAWFVGLIDNASFSALAAGDTAAQIGGSNGWLESSAYSESVRQTLTLGSAAAGSIDNTAAKAVFTCNTNGTVIKGGFVVSTSTKGGTTGVLYGEAAFSSTKAIDSSDTLTVTVTLTAVTA